MNTLQKTASLILSGLFLLGTDSSHSMDTPSLTEKSQLRHKALMEIFKEENLEIQMKFVSTLEAEARRDFEEMTKNINKDGKMTGDMMGYKDWMQSQMIKKLSVYAGNGWTFIDTVFINSQKKS